MNKNEISSIISILLLSFTLIPASGVKASLNSPINLTESTEAETHPLVIMEVKSHSSVMTVITGRFS